MMKKAVIVVELGYESSQDQTPKSSGTSEMKPKSRGAAKSAKSKSTTANNFAGREICWLLVPFAAEPQLKHCASSRHPPLRLPSTSVAAAEKGSGTFVRTVGMMKQRFCSVFDLTLKIKNLNHKSRGIKTDSNMLVAMLDFFFCITPLALVGAGTVVYDRFQRHRMRAGDNYRCSRCGFVFPAKGAVVSGFESHRYGLHVNCTRCGTVVEQFVKPNR